MIMPTLEPNLILKHKIKNRSRWFIFVVAAITILFTAYPVLGGQVVSNGAEMRYTLLRIESICEGWSNGYFPVRINPIFFGNYGLGASLTSPDFFLWIPAFLRRLGVGLTDAYNLFICGCVVACWCAVYKTGRVITKSRYGGLIAAATVVLSQYYTNVLFFRASYEDYLSFIFVPLVILGLYDMFYEGYKKPWIYAFSMLGLFCSSVRIFAVMTIISIVLFCVYAKVFSKNPRFLITVLVSFVSIAGITCSFWLPYFEQLRHSDFRTVTAVNWANSSVGINNLIANTQDMSSGSVMSASFGAVLILLTFLRFFVKKKDENRDMLQLADRLLFLGYVCLFLSSSLFPIKFWWLLKFIGYPARFYIFAVVFFAIAVAIIMHIGFSGKRLRSVALYALIVISILVNFAQADASDVTYLSFSNNYYKNDPTRTYSVSPLTTVPEGTEYEKFYKGNSVVLPSKTEIFITARDGTTLEFETDGLEKTGDLPLLYYYGYVAEFVDSAGNVKPLKIDGAGEGHTCRVYMPKGEKGTVRVWYKPTFIQNLSLGITVASSFVCAGLFGIVYSKRKKAQKISALPKED